jgi:hypothetical protein
MPQMGWFLKGEIMNQPKPRTLFLLLIGAGVLFFATIGALTVVLSSPVKLPQILVCLHHTPGISAFSSNGKDPNCIRRIPLYLEFVVYSKWGRRLVRFLTSDLGNRLEKVTTIDKEGRPEYIRASENSETETWQEWEQRFAEIRRQVGG